MSGESFAEQINGAHLSAEDPLFVQFRRSADVTFVEWLKNNRNDQTRPIRRTRKLMKKYTNNFEVIISFKLTSLVDTNHAISVLEASWPLTRHFISLFVHLLYMYTTAIMYHYKWNKNDYSFAFAAA